MVGVDHVIDKPLTYPHLAYVTGSVYDPVTDEADYAVSTEVLEHVDEPQKLVDCLYDSLNKHGIAMLTTPYLGYIPSGEHIWEFDYPDMYTLFKKFKQVWVMPYASNRRAVLADGTVSPSGNNDTIFVKAFK
jgi:2-polyprenyl-3-methyl-5-hydroxy-6-metoxy-1,4-benzoquinol methylase